MDKEIKQFKGKISALAGEIIYFLLVFENIFHFCFGVLKIFGFVLGYYNKPRMFSQLHMYIFPAVLTRKKLILIA